jgi:hypothetical protein
VSQTQIFIYLFIYLWVVEIIHPLIIFLKVLPTFIIEDLEVLSLAPGGELGPSECGDFLSKIFWLLRSPQSRLIGK